MRQIIYNNLSLRETEELLEIWNKNDRGEWTDLAFDVVEEILRERLGELPLRQKDVVDQITEVKLESDRQPEFYNRFQVLEIENRLYQVATASIVLVFVDGLLRLPKTQQIVLSYFGMNTAMNAVSWMIAFVLYVLASSLWSAILYFSIKALGSILRILMEMEANSR